jgi:hypothetical protein
MDERSRLTYLTRHYYELQGIRTAPLWLGFLAIQLNQNSVYSGTWIKDLQATLVMFLMFFFSWLASRYYRSRFGWLDPTWITLPTSRLYWSLVLGSAIFSFYRIIFTSYRGDLPYIFTIVWISPLFNEENPRMRRIYYALAGSVVVFSTFFIQLTHRNNAFILVIQCLALLALGIADHLLLMSLCTPPHENAHA